MQVEWTTLALVWMYAAGALSTDASFRALVQGHEKLDIVELPPNWWRYGCTILWFIYEPLMTIMEGFHNDE